MTDQDTAIPGFLEQAGAVQIDIKKLIDIGNSLATYGNIKGPIPPKLEELRKTFESALADFSRWLELRER